MIQNKKFQAFVQGLSHLLDSKPSEAKILEQGRSLLSALVAKDDWLPEIFAVPHPQFYQQYLLYADPQNRFSVVSFVWGPGQKTPVHDHMTWGLIGMLRGQEVDTHYYRQADQSLKRGESQLLTPGQVGSVSPATHDVHEVANFYSDQVSISIHVYGGNIGRIQRHVFHPVTGESKEFVSGYSNPFPRLNYQDVRARLLAKEEIALLDVREEDPHAQSHPLFAANFPLSRVEQDAYAKLPKRDACIVTFDSGVATAGQAQTDAELAAQRLISLGYTNVSVFDGGLLAWEKAGGELFRDVNVPSKSFGELVESKAHTPSLAAEEVQALINENADMVIVDVRRFDEYNTMSIPTAISCPGAEVVLRIAELAPRPETRVIVNCAGRTRSIIGTQSLINAGIPNKVNALRNGTIGWTLAGQALDRGQSRKFGDVSEQTLRSAAQRAREVADRTGVRRASLSDVHSWRSQADRTTYLFDTRTPQEYAEGHLPGFRSTPGGQLVQETEMVAPVRGARIVLADTDGVRANMTASWLAQMAWDVYVLDGVEKTSFAECGDWQAPLPPRFEAPQFEVEALAHALEMQEKGGLIVIDLAKHAQYVQGHIPNAYYVLRSQFGLALNALPKAACYVLTCPDGVQSSFAFREIKQLLDTQVSQQTPVDLRVLKGGTQAWKAAGLALQTGPTHLVSDPIDRYKRPYEGTEVAREAMQAYLDWEFGLVEQLGRDATHHFWVLSD